MKSECVCVIPFATQMRSLDEVAGDRTRFFTPFEHARTAVWVTQPADFVQLDGDLLWWNNVSPFVGKSEVTREKAFQSSPTRPVRRGILGRS